MLKKRFRGAFVKPSNIALSESTLM